jgi:PAS domain S-box-containing protein
MINADMRHDEEHRRILQEYIFNLEEARDKAEELAQAHEKLKQSQDLLVAVFGSTSHGMCLVRDDGFVWVNRAFSDILGWTQDELVGRSTRIIYADARQYRDIQSLICGDSRGNRLSAYEYEMLHRNGFRIPCLVNSRLLDDNDSSKGYVLSITDFTELKNAQMALKYTYEKLEERTDELVQTNEYLSREIKEHKETERKLNDYKNHLEELVKERTEALKRTNERLELEILERKQKEETLRKLEELESSILAAISHAVVGLRARTIIFANDAVEEVFGWKPEELIGKTTRLFYGTDRDYEAVGKLYSVLEKQKLYSAEIRCRHRDGRDMICRFNASRIGTSLTDKQIMVTYEDITEQKRVENALRESEEKYRSIFENSPLGICQTSLDGKFIKVNPALAQILGYDTPYEVVTSVSDIAHQVYSDPRRRAQILKRTVENRELVVHEDEYVRRDGKRWVGHIFLKMIRDENGVPHHLDGFVEDITEKKEMEERLQVTMKHLRTLSHRLLEVQETERRHIARELHDEIGQSLTALRIGLKRAERSVKAKATMAILNENTKIVDSLIKQVRTLSIELLPAILDDFGLVAALEWYIKWVADRAELHGDFHTEFTEERLAPFIEVTCFRIVQEALTNVVRHSNARNVLVRLEAQDGELHLVVKDDGDGFNVEKTHKRALKGRSFGLIGMQERASLAGGRLEFKSHAGQGTEVHAYFSLQFMNG